MAEVARLEESARELEERVETRARPSSTATRGRREALLAAIDEGARALDADIQTLTALRDELVRADEAATALRGSVDAQGRARFARARAGARGRSAPRPSELDVARATAESDLTHLAQMCVDTVQATLDEVLVDVEALEQAGQAVPDAAAIAAEEPDPEADDAEAGDRAAASAASVAPAAAVPRRRRR